MLDLTPEAHIISLGTGVQSSTMALMASVGELTPTFRGTPFLHHSLTPLSKIDFSTDSVQMELFENECEGMCGV